MFKYNRNNKLQTISFRSLCESMTAEEAFESILKEMDEDNNKDFDVEDSANEEALFEVEGLSEAVTNEQMSDEDLKIESLKIATNIAKLMSDVTTEDIIKIADTVSDFIRNQEIGGEEENNEESSEEESIGDLNFELSSEENSEESNENSEEK